MDVVYSYDDHLALIADLLAAPGSPSSSAAASGGSAAGSGVSVTLLLASLARHIAFLDDTALVHLVSVLLSSPIWYTQDGSERDVATTSAAPATPAVSFDRSRRILEAVRHGIAGRLDQIQGDYGTGWRARRKVSKSLGALWPILHNGDAASGIRLVVGTAVVQALLDVRPTKGRDQPSPWSSIATTTQEQLIDLWAESTLPQYRGDAPPTQDDVLLPWLAAGTLVDIPSERLHALATESFFDFAFSFIRCCFLDGRLFDILGNDLSAASEGLKWNETGPSFLLLNSLNGSAAHGLLGRFVRVLGKVIESITDEAAFQLLISRMEALETVCRNVQRDWARCKWSDLAGLDDLHPATRKQDAPWVVMKTLFFTMTMLYSSLIALLNSMPLPTNRPPNAIILDLAACSLRTFSRLHFITSKFAMESFGAYRSVWLGSLDLVARGGQGKVEQIAESFAPTFRSEIERAAAVEGNVSRSTVTYYLNAVEQIIVALPDEYLVSSVLPVAKPYLESKRYLDTFEAAHSVLLAVFARRKAVSLELAPWYADFLVNSYPHLLSISQLRLAFSTMTTSLSAQGKDALAWYCLDVLLDRIAGIRPIAPVDPALLSTTGHAERETLASVSATGSDPGDSNGRRETHGEAVDKLIPDEPTRLDEAPPPLGAEDAILRTPRGHLLLVLIDQLGTVNLCWLEPLSERVLWFLAEEEEAGNMESRNELVKILFKTLAAGMDMTKREAAAKWWMEHRQDLEWASRL